MPLYRDKKPSDLVEKDCLLISEGGVPYDYLCLQQRSYVAVLLSLQLNLMDTIQSPSLPALPHLNEVERVGEAGRPGAGQATEVPPTHPLLLSHSGGQKESPWDIRSHCGTSGVTVGHYSALALARNSTN